MKYLLVIIGLLVCAAGFGQTEPEPDCTVWTTRYTDVSIDVQDGELTAIVLGNECDLDRIKAVSPRLSLRYESSVGSYTSRPVYVSDSIARDAPFARIEARLDAIAAWMEEHPQVNDGTVWANAPAVGTVSLIISPDADDKSTDTATDLIHVLPATTCCPCCDGKGWIVTNAEAIVNAVHHPCGGGPVAGFGTCPVCKGDKSMTTERAKGFDGCEAKP